VTEFMAELKTLVRTRQGGAAAGKRAS
jgi:hypothetical protein